MKTLRVALIILSAMLLAASAERVYVQSLKADVMKEPSFKSEKVFSIEKGAELSVLESMPKWIKVGRGDKTGWVSALLVGTKPPLEKITVFTGAEEDIGRESRRRVSAVTSAAAARGLTEDDRRRLGSQTKTDYSALEKMEALSITDEELNEFINKRTD